MYNADPGLFAFYGNQRPPRNVPNYASPMGFQFSPRGYEQYVQSKCVWSKNTVSKVSSEMFITKTCWCNM